MVRWWEGDDVRGEAVLRGDGSGATEPTEHRLVELAGRPVGCIQCSLAADVVDGIVRPRHPGWTHAAASPRAANRASCRDLEKAGFVAVGGFESDHGTCQLSVTERARPAPAAHPSPA